MNLILLSKSTLYLPWNTLKTKDGYKIKIYSFFIKKGVEIKKK